MARSRANALDVVLIDRVPSIAARASAPTWSTPGSPCRNRRNDDSEAAPSARPRAWSAVGAAVLVGAVIRKSLGPRHNQGMAVASTRRTPVQKFKPTSGRAVGFLSVIVIVLAIGDLVVADHDLFALRVSLGLGVVALIVWMTMLRPRAVAYPDTLVLHNIATDTRLPMDKIEAVLVRHTLNVWIGDDRYVCVGI